MQGERQVGSVRTGSAAALRGVGVGVRRGGGPVRNVTGY